MNEKNLFIILGIIVLIAVAGLVMTHKQSTTGMVAPGTPVNKPLLTGAEHEGWYKVEITHHIMNFFDINEFSYAQDNICSRVIEETCNQIKKMKTSKIETFTAGQQNAYKLMIFEVAGELLGKITLIKGFDAPSELHLRLDKTIFTIRGWHENMQLNIALKGKKTGNTMMWESGNITAEDFECSFGQ